MTLAVGKKRQNETKGNLAKWLNAADCKSALFRVRRFESSSCHNRFKVLQCQKESPVALLVFFTKRSSNKGRLWCLAIFENRPKKPVFGVGFPGKITAVIPRCPDTDKDCITVEARQRVDWNPFSHFYRIRSSQFGPACRLE